MSKKQPPRVQLNFEPDYEPPPQDDRMTDIDIDIKDVDATEETIDMMPKVEEKEQINEKDIFDNMPDNLAVLPDKVREELEIDKMESQIQYQALCPETPRPKKQTINRVNKKPRKPMTEAHKAKLAEARKKALEVRRAKAQEKKQAKEIEQETKRLKQKQKLKEFEQLKQEVEKPVVAVREPEPQKQSPQVGLTMFTKKDLEDAQFEAIVKYDALRKKQKAEKKQAEMVERQKKELLNKIAPQQYRYRDGSNPWDRCY